MSSALIAICSLWLSDINDKAFCNDGKISVVTKPSNDLISPSASFLETTCNKKTDQNWCKRINETCLNSFL